MKQIPKIAGLGLVGVIAQQCMLPALALTQQPLDLDHSECKAMFMGRRNNLAKPPSDILELVRSMGKKPQITARRNDTGILSCTATGTATAYKGFEKNSGGFITTPITKPWYETLFSGNRQEIEITKFIYPKTS